MFREENKQFDLSDIYLVHYYPDGQQLDFLKKYYREYGFTLIAPDVHCYGID